MAEEPGLRELKKLRTRQLIAETARRMFAERSFEEVRVADVAWAAEVSEATVFNYFHTKEDLVFHGMEVFESELLAAVRDRPAGEPIVAAFARFVLQPRGFLAATDPDAAGYLVAVSRMIATSPALQSREREILARYTESLAALIAEDTAAEPDDLRPWLVARALIGTHQSLIEFVRRRLLDSAAHPADPAHPVDPAGPTGPADLVGPASPAHLADLAQEVATRGREALALLEQGLATYGAHPKP